MAQTTTDLSDAAEARSILSCPAAVQLVVDGVVDVLADQPEVGMQDLSGVPTFSCLPGTSLARAAGARRSALLTLESGLGPAGSADRSSVLSLGGRLVAGGLESCDCCERDRISVGLEVDLVRVELGGRRPVSIDAADFATPSLSLNRGFLQRSADHATTCHQEELRRAVATASGTRFGDVVGVSLTGLTASSVDLRWVDVTGSRARTLVFPRPARSTEELGDLLRSELDAGIC